MANNATYYYMRLKEDFFDSQELKVLEGMTDGFLYSNILLKMYLASLKGNGRLMFNDLIPYSPEMIASVTGHQVGTVKQALTLFEQMGLIEVLDNGAIYMLHIQNFVGKSSTEADRIRQMRADKEEEKKSLKPLEEKKNINLIDKSIESNMGVQMYDIRTPKKRSSRFAPPSVEEVAEYCSSRNNGIDAQAFIDFYEARGWSLGKSGKMKDWKAAVRTWENRRKEQGSPQKQESYAERKEREWAEMEREWNEMSEEGR